MAKLTLKLPKCSIFSKTPKPVLHIPVFMIPKGSDPPNKKPKVGNPDLQLYLTSLKKDYRTEVNHKDYQISARRARLNR